MKRHTRFAHITSASRSGASGTTMVSCRQGFSGGSSVSFRCAVAIVVKPMAQMAASRPWWCMADRRTRRAHTVVCPKRKNPPLGGGFFVCVVTGLEVPEVVFELEQFLLHLFAFE